MKWESGIPKQLQDGGCYSEVVVSSNLTVEEWIEKRAKKIVGPQKAGDSVKTRFRPRFPQGEKVPSFCSSLCKKYLQTKESNKQLKKERTIFFLLLHFLKPKMNLELFERVPFEMNRTSNSTYKSYILFNIICIVVM